VGVQAAGRLSAPPTVPPWVPLFCLLACLSAIWVAVAPLGDPRLWAAVGAGATLGALGGTMLSLTFRRRISVPLLALLMIGLGLWRAGSAFGDVRVAAQWAFPAERIRIQATIDAPVETRGTTATVYARLDRVLQPASAELPPGRIRAIVPALSPLEAGQLVEMTGRFEAVDPNSPTGTRLAREGVIAIASFPQIVPLGRPDRNGFAAMLHEVRSAIEATVQRTLPEPHAALLTGLLVGSAAGMPESLRLALVGSGTSHLVVVSGYNITLVAAFLQSIFRSARILRIAAPLFGVWAFTLLAGANAPAIRAALMATAALIALSTGRGADALGALALAAAGMLLLDPHLVFELGFQLSVLATLGLVALQPRVAALIGWIPERLREPVSSTLAAQLATAPLLAATFHQISVVAPLANLLAAPAIPVTTIVGAIGVALVGPLSMFAIPVAVLLALPTSYLVAVFEWTAALPGAVAPIGEIHPAVSAVYGAALLVWAIAPTPEGKSLIAVMRSSRLTRSLAAGTGVLCAAGIAALAGFGASRPPLVIAVLDVGHGDAILARTPSGRTLLIDGGPNPSALLAQIGRRMGILERDLSVVVLTRADADRLPGITAAIERYPPELLVGPPEGSTSALYQRWQGIGSSARSIAPDAGITISLEPDIALELIPTAPLAPLIETGPPQRTLVVRIVYGDTSVLVGPSLTAEAGRALIRESWPLRSDAIHVPRHGATLGLDPALIAALQPSVAVISVGASNRRDLPTAETLEALRGVSVFRTDLHGTVELRSDGRNLWVVPDRSTR